MTDSEERAYTEGERAAWSRMLGECLKGLGYDSPEATAARWAKEREELRAVIRRLCEEYGDTDYPDNLHLADVLTKHLEPYLTEREEEGGYERSCDPR